MALKQTTKDEVTLKSPTKLPRCGFAKGITTALIAVP
jgi:hypothetical protein